MKYRNQDEGGDPSALIEHQKKAKASQRSTGVGVWVLPRFEVGVCQCAQARGIL